MFSFLSSLVECEFYEGRGNVTLCNLLKKQNPKQGASFSSFVVYYNL